MVSSYSARNKIIVLQISKWNALNHADICEMSPKVSYETHTRYSIGNYCLGDPQMAKIKERGKLGHYPL